MKTAIDYPVTFPFGATTPPYSEAHPHPGGDRAMPEGVEVWVGNKLIGYSGTTGQSTGPHLHIQKMVAGTFVDPYNLGLGDSIAFPARVSEVGHNDEVGNYVRVMDARGVRWSYFHLSKYIVTVNTQISKKGYVMNEDDAKNVVYRGPLYREPENDQVWRTWVGKTPTEAISAVRGGTEWLTNNHILHTAYPQASKDLAIARDQLLELSKQLQAAKENLTPESLSQALETAETCRAQLEDANASTHNVQQQLNELKRQQADDAATGSAFLRWLGNIFNK